MKSGSATERVNKQDDNQDKDNEQNQGKGAKGRKTPLCKLKRTLLVKEGRDKKESRKRR